MSYAGILATVQLYQLEKADLTSQISDILMDITKASKQTSDYMEDENQKIRDLKTQYGSTSTTGSTDSSSSDYSESTDSTEYQVALQEVQDEYDAKLAEVNSWEKELEMQKQNLQTELTAVSTYLESFQKILQDNVKKDSTYGGGGQSG